MAKDAAQKEKSSKKRRESEMGATEVEVPAVVAQGPADGEPKKKKSKKVLGAPLSFGSSGDRWWKKPYDKDEDKEIPLEALSPIAHPLANKKLAKKVLRTVKKGVCALLFYVLLG
jgi:H/ACA ribonucleoprotein complex subunit 2